MKSQFVRSRVRHGLFAAFALVWVLTGCNSESGTFSAAASEKAAAEKGLKPGGPTPKEIPKFIRRGRQSTETGGTPLPTP